MPRGRGLDDAAGAVNLARGVMVLAIGADARCMSVEHRSVMAGAIGHAILPHIPCGAVPYRPPCSDARRMVPGRALDQLDVVRFLRRGLFRHVDRAAAEHGGARRRCHQFHDCRSNRHSPGSSIPAGDVAQRALPLSFHMPYGWQKRR